MINPPDDLLADLQSALPPDVEPPSSSSSSPYPPMANGGGYRPQNHTPREDHTYEMADREDEGGMANYEMPRLSVSPEVGQRERERERERGRGRGGGGGGGVWIAEGIEVCLCLW